MNHNQLAIVDGNEVFTIDEQTELEKQIDHVIAAHKNNRQEINRLVFECAFCQSYYSAIMAIFVLTYI